MHNDEQPTAFTTIWGFHGPHALHARSMWTPSMRKPFETAQLWVLAWDHSSLVSVTDTPNSDAGNVCKSPYLSLWAPMSHLSLCGACLVVSMPRDTAGLSTFVKMKLWKSFGHQNRTWLSTLLFALLQWHSHIDITTTDTMTLGYWVYKVHSCTKSRSDHTTDYINLKQIPISKLYSSPSPLPV